MLYALHPSSSLPPSSCILLFHGVARYISDKAEYNPADSSTKREWKYNDIFGLNVKGVADAGVYWSADAFMREWGRGIVMHGIKVVIRM